MLDYIRENVEESIAAKEKLLRDEALLETVGRVAQLCVDAYQRGNKLLICGNGGSASDALHMAGELVGRYQMERRGISAIVLNANTAVMSAIANDYDYDNVFSKQVAALGNAGDVLLGLSTSGNSVNVVNALQEAKKRHISTVGLTGASGGRMRPDADYLLNVPSYNTPRIQEMHILLIHTICGLIENGLCERGFWMEEQS
ncbi:MAG: D-sedoheptulose 7-phosphate isomerase [Lachnospiraceae bacterium]|nr:D-sedoheptulose 7-phosphate isomerase [Lachnospiraceae bacterium]